MENATQALFMAAGVLIAVMIISLGIYLFSSASTISENYDRTMSATEIQKFNSKFSGFDKTPSYTSEGIYYNYNTISEVISAVNLAYSINAKNNYDIQSSIQVSINIAPGKTYGITPLIQKIYYQNYINELNQGKKVDSVDKNKIYSIDPSSKEINKTEPTGDLVDINKFLKDYSESKLVTINGEKERIYQYGFKGEVFYNDETGLVDRIHFSIDENGEYKNY